MADAPATYAAPALQLAAQSAEHCTDRAAASAQMLAMIDAVAPHCGRGAASPA